MAETPSPDGAIDWSAHPYATETERPDGCTVSQPVVVSLRLHEAPGGVKDYDDRKASAATEFLFDARWLDPRLADWPAHKPTPEGLWVPEVNFAAAGPAFSKTKVDGAPVGIVKGAPPGTLTQLHSAKMDVSCQASANIQQFPLDKHLVTFMFVMAEGGGSEYEVFSNDGAAGALTGQDGPRGDRPVVIATQEEWRTAAVYWATAQHVSSNTGVAYSDFVVSLERRRMPQYILHKAVYPTTLSAFFGLYSLALPSTSLDGRLGVLLSLFLTVFAIQWTTTEHMPKIPALTWLDRKVYSVVLFLFSMATVSFGLNLAAKLGADPELLVTGDWCTLGLFSVVLLMAVVVGSAQIRRQETMVGADVVSPDWWSLDMFGIQTFKGSAYRATTNGDGVLGEAEAIAGQTDPPSLSTSANPLR
jgi:hypothetical protein